MLSLFFLTTGTLFICTNAYAYLDPGTGSIIIQALLGAAAVLMTTLSVYWQKTKDIFFRFIKFIKKGKKNL